MRSRSKHLPADERRAVTVEAVISLSAKQNPSEITTAAIAKQMGVTQGSLFKHFPTKEAILQAVMEWVAEGLLARVDAAACFAASPMTALKAMYMAHIQFVTDHPGVPRMVFGELQRAEPTAPKQLVQKLIRRYGERVHRLIEQGKESGELVAGLDSEAAATLFIGTIQGLVRMHILSFMGADASAFRAYDAKTHHAARALEEAASRRDASAVISSFAALQDSCSACHQRFRKPFVEHFYGKD
jgi:AcrR family transcriptional regulator